MRYLAKGFAAMFVILAASQLILVKAQPDFVDTGIHITSAKYTINQLNPHENTTAILNINVVSFLS